MSGTDVALVPLGQVVADAAEDQEPVPGFMGWFEGAEYLVTAMLQRTAVLEVPGDRWADKEVVLLADVLVDPSAIRWRPKPPPPNYRAWRGRRRVGADPEARRQASDERARADQERRQVVEAAAAPPLRPAAAVSRLRSAASGGAAGRPGPVSSGGTVPRQPTSGGGRVASPGSRLPAVILELATQLEQARGRVAELEAERERSQAAQRRLVRQVRAAIRWRAKS
jgi:hypothetical protein